MSIERFIEDIKEAQRRNSIELPPLGPQKKEKEEPRRGVDVEVPADLQQTFNEAYRLSSITKIDLPNLPVAR